MPAVPSNEIAARAHPHPEGHPRVLPIGQPERPERYRGREVRPDLFVSGDRFCHQSLLGSAHPIDMAGKVHTGEQRAAKPKCDLVVVPFRLRVGPDGCLFGCYRCGRRGRDRGVTQEVLLVTGGVELEARQQRVVRPHAT